MATNINRVILAGRITKDPEIKYTKEKNDNEQEVAVVKFTLATKRKNHRDITDFIPCVAFGRTAEFIGKYFKKGDGMVGLGSLLPGSYINREGKKVYTFDVNVNDVDFTESKRSDQNQSENQNVQNQPNQPNSNLSQFPTQQPMSNPNTQYQPRSNQNQVPNTKSQQIPTQQLNSNQVQQPGVNQATQQTRTNQSQSMQQAVPNQNGQQAAPNQSSANSYPENDYYSNMALDNGYFDDASFDLGLQ